MRLPPPTGEASNTSAKPAEPPLCQRRIAVQGAVHHQVQVIADPVPLEVVHPEAARAGAAGAAGNCPDSESGLTFASQGMELIAAAEQRLAQYFITVMVKFGRQARER